MARRCHYCDAAPGATKDHIVPKALSGPNAKWNYVEACSECNGDKGQNWPTCPCGICTLAVEMFLFAKERGLTRWPPDVFEDFRVKARRERLLLSTFETYRVPLWDTRVVRFERWEDASWIGVADRVYDPSRRRTRVRYRSPHRPAPPHAPRDPQEWDAWYEDNYLANP